jgi:hypothetical protein
MRKNIEEEEEEEKVKRGKLRKRQRGTRREDKENKTLFKKGNTH